MFFGLELYQLISNFHFLFSDPSWRSFRFSTSSLTPDLLNDVDSFINNRMFNKNCLSYFNRTNPWTKHGRSFQYKNRFSNHWRIFVINLWFNVFRRSRNYFHPHYFYPSAIHQIKKTNCDLNKIKIWRNIFEQTLIKNPLNREEDQKWAQVCTILWNFQYLK